MRYRILSMIIQDLAHTSKENWTWTELVQMLEGYQRTPQNELDEAIPRQPRDSN